MKVIGTKDCPRCDILVTLLNQQTKDFTYLYVEELEPEAREAFYREAQEKSVTSFPVIQVNDKWYGLKDYLNNKDNIQEGS